MQTWGAEYSNAGDYVVFYETAWWVPVVEFVGVPFIRYGITYMLGCWILNLTEYGRKEIHREPLPGTLSDAWWRD